MDRFELGELYMTSGVSDRSEEDTGFATFVFVSLERHKRGDWGNLCEEDVAVNEDALKYGGRLMSAYKRKDHPDDKIWIITEADRSATTVLFPDEY